MRQYVQAILLLLAAALPLPGSADSEIDTIVAVVDEDVVMRSELDGQMRRVMSQIRQQGAQVPPRSVFERQVLERLILQKIQMQMAERTGITVDDDALNSAINKIASENGLNLRQFREILEQDGYAFASFREDIRDEITVTRLRQREVENRVTVTDREIDTQLSNVHQQEGGDAAEFHILHILVEVPDGGDEEAVRGEAEELRRLILDGADFQDVARRHSDDRGSAINGGDLGWVNPGDLVPEFEQVMNTLAPNDVSEPFESPFGLHIVRVLARRTHDDTEEVRRAQAREVIRKRKVEEEYDAWLRKLRDEAYVEYRLEE